MRVFFISLIFALLAVVCKAQDVQMASDTNYVEEDTSTVIQLCGDTSSMSQQHCYTLSFNVIKKFNLCKQNPCNRCAYIILLICLVVVIIIAVCRKKANKLVWLSILTVLLLALFAWSQHYDCKFLSLDPKWLILACLPVLIGLFISGYIKSFKWQGFEFVANLDVLSIREKILLIEYEQYTTHTKGGYYNKDKNKNNNLLFINGRTDYYEKQKIIECLCKIPNIHYLVVTDSDMKFQYMLSISCFEQRQQIKDGQQIKTQKYDENKIEIFRKALEEEKIGSEFADKTVSHFVYDTDNLVEAYTKILNTVESTRLKQSEEILPVLDKDRKIKGVIGKRQIEEKLTLEVIKKIKRRN